MREIQMVDLTSQYIRIKQEADKAIGSVIEDSTFIRGKDVELFENELADYLQIKNVIACGNGTDALQVALMSLGLNQGDEVITSDFTFIATVEVITLLGLKPVLVDPEPGTFNISADAIRKAVTDRTRVIMPVHLFGQCADMENIIEVARTNNLFIIEDTAQATGARYRFSNGNEMMAGTMGHIGCTSFFPSKNLGCFGDGGAIFTSDNELAAKIRSIVNHGMTRRYYHDHIGVNSRLDTIQAAILRIKLRHLDSFNKARRDLAEKYDSAFKNIKGIEIPARSRNSSHIFHQYTICLDEARRDKLKEHLALNGIPSMIYYPVPLHRQKAYSYLGLADEQYPVTETLCKIVLSLPMHTEMDNEQSSYIIEKVIDFFNEKES